MARSYTRLVAVVGLLVLVMSPRPIRSQSRDLARLVQEYRAGNTDEAVRELAGWPAIRVPAETSLFQSSDPLDTAALILLRLEAYRLKDTSVSATFDVLPLVEKVARIAETKSDRRLQEFCRNWYIVAFASEAHRSGLGVGFIGGGQVVIRFGLAESADIQLLLGSFSERAMGPQDIDFRGPRVGDSDRRPDFVSTPFGNFDGNIGRDAQAAFERALKFDPTLSEARLRLGHVLYLLNHKQDAEKQLTQAVKEAAAGHDVFSQYLGALMLGQLDENAGRLSDAIDHYRQATEVQPDGLSARVALGQALVAAGRPDEGWAATQLIFGTPGKASLSSPDPWSLYSEAQYHLPAEARLAAMRALVSAIPATPATPEGRVNAALTAATSVSAPSPNVGVPLSSNADRVAFRTGVNGVRVDVVVQDGTRSVARLTADDFEVMDNGVIQRIETISAAGAVKVALLVDTSDSVRGVWPSMVLGAEAAVAALGPGDVMSIVSVSDRATLLADAVGDPGALDRVLQHMRPEQTKTALWDAVFAGASLVAERGDRPLVLVVTDGQDNVSWFDRSRAFDRLARAGLTVDAIAVPPDHRAAARDHMEDASLGPLAAKTGGVLFDVARPDLSASVAARFQDLRAGYVLMYQPTNVRQDDGWHDIAVKLRDSKKGKVQARPGYYAAAPVKKAGR
jgi:VWFA-related protein